ncbi:MAG: hypothetical protein ACD_44C00445G0002 [uncultured bacterium]|nr:MAG: hypothetical protein ACD_44C00445G0002 [uncultured bacterium]OGT24299.1 MAG: hypothetical protein A2W47_00400 [Gammaproteobacteria bacterium RIFCSPHIGHO2_12_38_15]OGT68258.1 MAG: hypothetical protein A3I12_04760 [Gammaproteobacteria bacterium RIFCSPLOWO2_02_FULL_38_11]OGT77477.1 MAG: hypothetical protein A3G71_05295 [Gammaproteobacteria bacterium RIFCSPLOWO2_12_FULL_38_14]
MYFSLKSNLSQFLVSWLMKQNPSDKFPLSDFERIRYEIRPCDVLLIEGRSRVAEVINLITQSAWSHACLYIGRLHDIENPDTRNLLLKAHPDINPNEQLIVEGLLGKGTVISPITDYNNDHIRICRPKGITHKDAQLVIDYAVNHLGIKYDIRQIFDLARFLFPWSILPRRWRSSLFNYHLGELTKESCSSLIAEAFSSVQFPILPVIKQHHGKGIELIKRFPKLYTPSDFDYSPFFEIIKYPIFELSDTPTYRTLPWREGLLSDDEGHIARPELPKIEETLPSYEKNKKSKKKEEKKHLWDYFD